jgi:prophage antirepressor-like protein
MHSLFLHNQVVSTTMALHTFHTDFGDHKATLTAILVDGAPWFRGIEAAASIGHKDPRRAIYAHVGDEDKYDLSPGLLAKSSKITTLHISERGLCSLMSSKLPHAKVFQNWVLNDVLPTIRQMDGYIAHPVLEDVEPIRTDTRCVHADVISSSSSSSSAPVDLDQKLENITKDLWEVKHELYLRKQNNSAVTRERSLKRQRAV